MITELPVRAVHLEVDGRKVSLMLPADPEGWMGPMWEKHGSVDARFPFWLEAWPSAYGLWCFLSTRGIPLQGGLEIGCGCGVLAQLLVEEPGTILHTDLMPEAVSFAQKATLMQHPSVKRHFFSLDVWWPSLQKKLPVLIGSDLCYDDKLVRGVANAVKELLLPNASAWIADPCRAGREHVPALFAECGLKVEQYPWEYQLEGKLVKMKVYRLVAD